MERFGMNTRICQLLFKNWKAYTIRPGILCGQGRIRTADFRWKCALQIASVSLVSCLPLSLLFL